MTPEQEQVLKEHLQAIAKFSMTTATQPQCKP